METIKPPIFIGKDADANEEDWYFFAVKDKLLRLIRYVKYPYWASGSDLPGRLDFSTLPPEEIMNDVENFIKGRIEYELVPKKQGRAERVIRRLLPEGDKSDDEAGNSGTEQGIPDRSSGTYGTATGKDLVPDAPRGGQRNAAPGRRLQPGSSTSNVGGDTSKPASVERKRKVIIPERVVPEAKPEVKAEAAPKRGRGRPRKEVVQA